jgi:quinol monooxygenase YgiN
LAAGRQKFSAAAIRLRPRLRPWRVRKQKGRTVSEEPTVLINVLKVEPAKQEALIALLQQNTESVITTLKGWKSTRLIAARDGASVVICSEWENAADVEAMRRDPRMQAYFPEILELASLDSMVGSVVLDKGR